jgi:hypothetical protein
MIILLHHKIINKQGAAIPLQPALCSILSPVPEDLRLFGARMFRKSVLKILLFPALKAFISPKSSTVSEYWQAFGQIL